MKYIFTSFMLLFLHTALSQTALPDFLQGTWKMEHKEVYEHWDKLHENSMKGFSYRLKDGVMLVSEYLEISRSRKGTLYTATVLRQNKGKGVNFRLTHSDSAYVFENQKHDFPQKIVYKKLDDTEIFVEVSAGGKKGGSFKMQRLSAKSPEKDSTVSNPNYDGALAKKSGADDYGMKAYVLVLLKTGPNNTADKDFINTCFRGHLDNITRLVDAGKMVVAGPLGKNDKTYRGIFILQTNTLEEAGQLLQTDPAIKEGLLDVELYKWYGSAALSEYLPFSEKIWKIKP